MKADGLFVITAIVFIFVAWVATGGPSRPIAHQGPFITPVTRSGEESQGYRGLAPTNPINTTSYPRQIGGAGATISKPDAYTRPTGSGNSSLSSSVYIEHSSVGPYASNPNLEYVSLINSGLATTTASGWSLASKATGTSMQIPSFILPPLSKVVIVTGNVSSGGLGMCASGTNCISLNRGSEFYAASQETITLKDASGKVIDTYSY